MSNLLDSLKRVCLQDETYNTQHKLGMFFSAKNTKH